MPNGDQRYDTHDYAGDRADDVSIAMRRMPDEDRSTNAEIQQSITQSQREQLAPDVEMGNDRVVVPQNWESRTSTQLYLGATDKNVPTSADDLGRGFTEGGNRLAEAANRLLDAVTALDHAWKGDAAEAARNALTPLAKRTGAAGISAQFMGTAMSDQALAAAKVRNMPEPAEFDRDAAMTEALANPNPTAGMADMQAKEQAAQKVKAEQVRYMTEYTTTMAEIDARTPTFVPPPERGIDDGGGGGFRGGRGVGYDETFTGGGNGPGGSTGGDRASGFAPGRGGANAPGIFVPLPGENGFEGTDLSGYNPGTPTPNQPGINPGAGPALTPTGSGPGGAPAPVGQFGGRGAGGPGAGRAPMSGYAPKPATPGGAGTGNPGAARPGTGGPGVAGRPGGPGAGATGGRGAAAAGAGGRGGAMGGAGGRGANGEEDGEHQRPSYLVEPDAEATFGTDQVTAPPVIGE
ncbi:hypothetical protein ACFPM7_07015 [Actinokineospora guangxiensis]|uniref:PPE family protein n=1 Tax=Actinokineospora guangxiensis TaxID=1490288 RepID=A0ABW0EJB3_9PSEU